jgi:hypothetical protein
MLELFKNMEFLSYKIYFILVKTNNKSKEVGFFLLNHLFSMHVPLQKQYSMLRVVFIFTYNPIDTALNSTVKLSQTSVGLDS